MFSPDQVADVYLVQVRCPNGTVDQVSGMEYPEFPDALHAANKLSAWLRYGHRYTLPEDAQELPQDLLRQGIAPGSVAVEVAYPAAGDGNGYAVACQAMALTDDDDALPDTVLEEVVPVLTECPAVRADAGHGVRGPFGAVDVRARRQ